MHPRNMTHDEFLAALEEAVEHCPSSRPYTRQLIEEAVKRLRGDSDEIRELKDEIRELNGAIDRRDEAIDRQDETIRELNETIDRQDEMIGQKDNRLARLLIGLDEEPLKLEWARRVVREALHLTGEGSA